MKTEEEKEERKNKADMEVIGFLCDKDLTYGEGINTLTQCLASLIASNPDKRKRAEALVYVITSLTEMVATFGEAIEEDVLRMPEEGGGE